MFGTAKQLSLSRTTALISTFSEPAKALDKGIGKLLNVDTVACGRHSDGFRSNRNTLSVPDKLIEDIFGLLQKNVCLIKGALKRVRCCQEPMRRTAKPGVLRCGSEKLEAQLHREIIIRRRRALFSFQLSSRKHIIIRTLTRRSNEQHHSHDFHHRHTDQAPQRSDSTWYPPQAGRRKANRYHRATSSPSRSRRVRSTVASSSKARLIHHTTKPTPISDLRTNNTSQPKTT